MVYCLNDCDVLKSDALEFIVENYPKYFFKIAKKMLPERYYPILETYKDDYKKENRILRSLINYHDFKY